MMNPENRHITAVSEPLIIEFTGEVTDQDTPRATSAVQWGLLVCDQCKGAGRYILVSDEGGYEVECVQCEGHGVRWQPVDCALLGAKDAN